MIFLLFSQMFLELQDKTKLHYELYNQQSPNPPILIIPGMYINYLVISTPILYLVSNNVWYRSSTSGDFSSLITRFPKHPVLVFDPRGTGSSTITFNSKNVQNAVNPFEQLTINTLCGDVFDLIIKMKWKQVSLIGHGAGGLGYTKK